MENIIEFSFVPDGIYLELPSQPRCQQEYHRTTLDLYDKNVYLFMTITFFIEPQELVISLGSSVRWVKEDPLAHKMIAVARPSEDA